VHNEQEEIKNSERIILNTRESTNPSMIVLPPKELFMNFEKRSQ
jgi:hypothetical protein